MIDPSDSTIFEATAASGELRPFVAAPDDDTRTGEGRRGGRPPRALAETTRLGRYIALETLGAGGMGVVVAAYDPSLDRKVAIKLLHGLQRDDTPRRLRLEREAQAMARLSHPNVVTLYEIGEHEGQLFLAMEFVKGRDLRRWLAERGPRARWRDVLDVFLQAGQGLAAAHAVGIVHRDFKPGNVFVGDDGRVRVGDFGLARQEADSETAATRARLGTDDPVLGWQVTATGAVMGTPGYMAPEQFRGEATDARTDQFAFCVALWEALYGQRPFAGATFADMCVAVTEGRRAPPPPGSAVPAWLRRVLARGLSREPGARYATTDALLAALRADPTRRRRLLAGAAAFALALVGGLGVQRYTEAREVAACEADGASITEVWNDDAEQALRAGLLATGVAYAGTTADRMTPHLAAQAEAWRQGRTTACLNARVRGTWDADTLDRAQGCLDERRSELAALVGEFSQASPLSVINAVLAATKLSRVEPCLDAARLARLPPPPDDRAGARAVQALLFQADARHAAGKYDDALRLADDALSRALAWPPLVAAAQLRRGGALLESGQYRDAEVALKEAYFQAAEAGAWEVAASAARLLLFVVGSMQARPDEGRAWGRHVEVALAHLGADDHSLSRAHLLNDLAVLSRKTGDYADAKAHHERALAIKEQVLGPDHPDVATSLSNLALVHENMGAFAAARALGVRALAIREKSLGPDHPDAAASMDNLAIFQRGLGALDEARRLHTRALVTLERAFDPDHPTTANVLLNLALVHGDMGAYATARHLHERSLAIREKVLGPAHPDVAESLAGLASVHTATHEYEEADRLYARALAIRERALGPEHLAVAEPLAGLAAVRAATHEYEEADRLYARALAIRERALGPDHPTVAESLTALAAVRAPTGRTEDARALAGRALAIVEKALPPDHPKLADPLMVLATVALAEGRSDDAAELAGRALHIRELRPVPPEKLDEARTLRARALPTDDRRPGLGGSAVSGSAVGGSAD